MGLLGASKWGPDGANSSTTPEPDTPKALRERRSHGGKKETTSTSPRNSRAPIVKKINDTSRRRKTLVERITRDNTKPAELSAVRQNENTLRLGNGFDDAYGNEGGIKPAPVEPTTRAEVKPTPTPSRSHMGSAGMAGMPSKDPDSATPPKSTTLEVTKHIDTPAPTQPTTSQPKEMSVDKPSIIPTPPANTLPPPSPTTHPTPSTGTLPQPQPLQSDPTFRIPTQSTLSDTEFYFLIAKLRGREISAREWEDAAEWVKGVGFGLASDTSSSAAMQHERLIEQEVVPVAETVTVEAPMKLDMNEGAELKIYVEVDEDEEW